MDESYPDMFIEQIEQLKNNIADKFIVESFRRVAEESRSKKIQEKTVKLVMDQLESAFVSAVSKLGLLKELLEEGDDVVKIMEDYKKKLKNEMEDDAYENREYVNKLDQFISEKTKNILYN